MKFRMRVILMLFVLLALGSSAMSIMAQEEIPPADIVNDEGGPAIVNGSFPISSQNVIDSTSQPVVILEDQAGYVDRDHDFIFSRPSQVMGVFTSPYAVGTMTYTLGLPVQPQGEARDVDNNSSADPGVQIYAVALWDNRFGTDVYVDEYDGTGWSGAFASTRVSINPETLNEYVGGQVLIWAPDDAQAFPAGFGDDGLLFTEDDPLVTVPAGWTLVNMDSDPFTFDRSREVTMDLYEPDSFVPHDFSGLGYADAFNALVDTAIMEYAFTESKGIDWEALRAEFLPRFEEAQANGDNAAYLFALRDFAWSIPDGHVGLYGPTAPLDQDFTTNTDGGLGMAVRELSDGRVLVAFVREEGPAADAGIELLAEIIAVNGVPVLDAAAEVRPYSLPFSTEEFARVQRLRYLFAAPVGTEYTLTYRNPGAAEETTVTLTTIAERDSFAFTSIFSGRTGLEPLISFRFLENGMGYIEVTSFGENEPLLIRTWEAFMAQANSSNAPAIIVDLRYNGGGFSSFGTRMASYFFNERAVVRYGEDYNPEIDAFFRDEIYPTELLPPLDSSLIYNGPVAVLVSQACASACELFAYDMDYNDRVTIIGQYASNGIAGGWPLLYMPDDIIFALPTGRPVDAEGNIIIEGIAIQPEVRVPVDEDSILRQGEDIILEAAVAHLESSIAAALEESTVEAGAIALGESLTGELVEGRRLRYTFTAPADAQLDILVTDETGQLDTVLRIYVADNPTSVAAENDDLDATTLNSGFRGIDIPGNLPLILEVGGYADSQSGTFTITVQEFEEPELVINDGGLIAIGDTVQGDLDLGVRVRYTLTVEADGVIDINLGDDAGTLDTYLRVYVDGAEEATYENDDLQLGVEVNSALTGIEVTAGQVLVIEAGGYADTSVGTYTLTVTASGE